MNRQPLLKLGYLVTALLFCLSGRAQSSYDDYRALDKVFKYREDFNTTSYRWETDVEGKSEAEVRGGALVFKSIKAKICQHRV